MANMLIKFLDHKDKTSIEVRCMDGIISIFARSDKDDVLGTCVHLDKSTAIKFSKTLRTEINKIQ